MFIPMSQGMVIPTGDIYIQVMSDTYYHLVRSHKDYVMKSVVLCNGIASSSSFTSKENILLLGHGK